jgi:hypothetical protein
VSDYPTTPQPEREPPEAGRQLSDQQRPEWEQSQQPSSDRPETPAEPPGGIPPSSPAPPGQPRPSAPADHPIENAPPGWHPDPWNQAPARWWDGSGWTDRTRSAPEDSPAASADQGVRVLVLGGAALLVIAAFMPWVTMSAPLVGRISALGIEGDGMLTAGLGVVALILGIPLMRGAGIKRGRAIGLLVVGALASLVAILAVINIQAGAAEIVLGIGQVGVGLWLTVAAAATLVAGSVRGLARSS